MTKSTKAAKSTKSTKATTKRISFVEIANELNVSDKSFRAKFRRIQNARELYFDETTKRWSCAENEKQAVIDMYQQRVNAA